MIFHMHMTRLTQANQIGTHICLFGCSKLPKWALVVNRKTFTNEISASSALALLLNNNNLAGNDPTVPAICARATNPHRTVRSALEFGSILTSALRRAKTSLISFLAKYPWLESEDTLAILANQRDRLDIHRIVFTSHLTGLKTGLVGFCHRFQIALTLHKPATLARTVLWATCRVDIVDLAQLSHKDDTAMLARYWLTSVFHRTPPVSIIPHFMGAGTVALVSIRLQRQYLGIELNPEYVRLIEKRIAEVQPTLWAGGVA